MAIVLRFLPTILAVAAILGGMAWIDHRGYQRARNDAEADAKFERTVTALLIERAARRQEQRLVARIAAIDTALAERLGSIETTRRTNVQPVIAKELARDPSLSEPDRAMSDCLRDAVNAAISETAGPAAAPRADR